MKIHRAALVISALLTLDAVAAPRASQAPRPADPQQQPGAETTVVGRIVAIHAPRVFTVRDAASGDRELFVLAPRALSPDSVGAPVTAGGVLRRLTEAQLKRADAFSSIDERTRTSLAGHPVLVASSLIVVREGERLPAARQAPPLSAWAQSIADRYQRDRRDDSKPLTLSAAMLAAHLDEFAGRPLRVTRARVVGVFQPDAFLVEPATPYLKAMGLRDRVLVQIDSASLRAPAELIVGSIVTVTGVARTLVGVQVTREVQWPAQLQPEAVKRLEVCGALLATSVQTPEGTELTDRQPAATVR